ALNSLDQAAATLTNNQASLGASNNELVYLSANLSTAIEQNANAASAIRDTNMAEAVTEQTKQNMLNQIGLAVQAQANQNNQEVLQLIQ
ncbi:MAG: flagellin, partial [Zetaproteobacteria bacterium]|nr:flagellin [Zetaproteobacteria bacterium]